MEPTNIPEQIEQPAPPEAGGPSSRCGWGVAALLVLIIVLGAIFRLTGVDWDEQQHLHPDERFLTMVETAMALPGDVFGDPPPGCAQWGGYFDTKCSPLNPYNHDFGLFVYGTFPMFLVRVVAQVISMTGYDQVYLVGRVLSALFDLSTVLLIFFIGRRLYGTRAGLLGAFFLTSSVLDIQQSHFFTVDTFTNVPILIAFWYALDIVDGKPFKVTYGSAAVVALLVLPSVFLFGPLLGLLTFALLFLGYILLGLLDHYFPVRYLLAGMAFGLALAGRINIAPFAAVLIAAAALRAYLQAVSSTREATAVTEATPYLAVEESPERLPIAQAVAVGPGGQATMARSFGPLSVSVAWRERAQAVRASFGDSLYRSSMRAFFGLAVAAIAALVLFRIFQPYAANGPSFISPKVPRLDVSRGAVTAMMDLALSWAGGVNSKFADNMTYVSDLVAGKIDAPPGHQWTGRTPYVFPFDNMVQWGLGVPLGLAGWAGFLLALYQLIRYRKWNHLLIVVWVGITFAYTGQQFVKTMRYFLQIYPFLALLGGWFIVELWDRVSRLQNEYQLSDDDEEAHAAERSFIPRPLLQGGVVVIAAIIVGYTLFYAGAFTSIYTRPVTRVAASRWMLANIPPGSVIANEHWDDPLPLRVDGKDPWGGMYKNLQPASPDGLMDWYNEDTPEKRTQAIQWLDAADYIVLSSNRLYGSIPRLPMRYPLTTKYYQWLFDGTLGFEKVAEFTSRPQLLGIEINDDNSEEAFTVYDHPKVLIFKKTPQYSHALAESLFNSVDLSEVYRFFPREATQAPTALLLTSQQWTIDMQGGTWTQIFNPDDLINKIPVIGWLAMLEILGWLAFPIAFLVFRGLTDRGYVFAKALGILLPAWGAWMLASFQLIAFSRFSIVFVLFFVILASAIIVRLRWRELLTFVRSQSRVLLVEEALFLAFFGLDLAIRYGNPDLWHPWFGGEKPMDFAYLNAVIKSTYFPPYDPWFAGGYIDYYYFGQLITATLIRLSGIVPEVAYNLALPMYFALLGMGAFALVFNLVAHIQREPRAQAIEGESGDPATGGVLWGALLFGLLGALLVTVIGNLGELVLIGQTFAKLAGAGDTTSGFGYVGNILTGILRVVVDRQPFDIPINVWYWNASRVIPDTINEFPFFTFLYADLHAHLMALPFTLVVLGFAANFVLRTRDDDAHLPFWPYMRMSPVDVIEVVVVSLVVGALRAINFADYPTYMLVVAGALAIGEYGRAGRITLQVIGQVAWRLIAIVALTTILYQPFISNFATAYLATELWTGARTTLGEYIVVYGILLFPIATFLSLQCLETRFGRGWRRYLGGAAAHAGRLSRYVGLHSLLAAPNSWFDDLMIVGIGGAFVIEVVLLAIQWWVFALAFPLLVLAGMLVVQPDLASGRRLVALLVAAGLAMTLMVELITYKGDIGRMNTVFKFYLQVWVFFGISAAAGLAYLTTGRPTLDFRFRIADSERRGHAPAISKFQLPSLWWVVFGALLFSGFLYPILASRAKVNDRFVAGSPPGLNGMDYMQNAVYQDRDRDMPLEYDREAIDWIRQNIPGSPVILEANGPLYHWTSRVSIYTGDPTVIGWDWHQKQQRSIIDGAIIDNRIAQVATLYNSVNIPDTLALLKRYHVSYVYVGDMEKAFYEAPGLAKFDTMVGNGTLDVVYENDHVKIYRVKG